MRSVLRFVAPMLAVGLTLSAPGSRSAAAPCTSDHPVNVGFTFEPWHPCPSRDVHLWVGGCRECVTLLGVEAVDSATVRVRCAAPEVCPAILACTAESLQVNLGRFPLGDHVVRVEIMATILLASGDSCTTTENRELGFTVGEVCPPGTNLPYVDSIKIGPTPPCSGCTPNAICAGVPIPVALAGNLTGDCLHIRDVRVVFLRGFPPGPAGVIVEVGRDSCQIRDCIPNPIPWSARVEIPGLPPGEYKLPVYVEELTEHCDGSTTPGGFWSSLEPYSVTDSCATPTDSCFVSSWDHGAREGTCDAFVAPDHPATVTLQVMTMIALAGLQGRIVLWPSGLQITSLKPVGPALGMRIAWNVTSDGAKFAMFAEQGAPIPPWPPEFGAVPQPFPVLEVTASATAGTPIPAVTRVDAVELMGSDERGRSVKECPILYIRDNRFVDPAAHICAASPCDFNADAVTDVRDLVLMAHCVLQSGYCPPDAAGHLDCDRSGVVDIGDVMCCARVFLQGPAPPGVPGRPEPEIRLSFREPIVGAGGIDLPVRLEGADRIGAARLAIRYPGDCFEVSGVELAGDASSWLCLHEKNADRLTVGLIGLAPASGPLNLTLRLTPRPGTRPSGDVRVESAEFAGRDGAALDVGLGEPAWSFDGPPGLALSPGEPNPFSRATRVQVTLARPAVVEISVHDLGGRRIAMLQSGALAAGSHPFSWNGTRRDGSAAPNGVYLLRASAGREIATRKLVLLRGE